MASDSVDTYLAFRLRGGDFAVPLSQVAGVATLSADEAERLRESGIFPWQGFFCTLWKRDEFRAEPETGDTVIVLETSHGRHAIVSQGETRFEQAGRRLPLPEALVRRYPSVREAFWENGKLVHCVEVEAQEG